MKNSFLTFICSIRKTIFHLSIILVFGGALVLTNLFAPEETIINNLLIGLVSGLAASYLIAIFEILRINKNTRNKISCLFALFTEYTSECIATRSYDFMGLYKIYADLCSCSKDLCYKSNFDEISKDISNILDLIKIKAPFNKVDVSLAKLRKAITKF